MVNYKPKQNNDNELEGREFEPCTKPDPEAIEGLFKEPYYSLHKIAVANYSK